MIHDPQRLLDFPSLLNARELGGYPTSDGSRTRWRALVRADDLAQLTADGVRAFAAYGIETVIDLRWPEELELSPNPVPRDLPQVRYHHVSLLADSANQWARLSKGCAKEMWKCAVLERTRLELKAVLQAIAAAPPGPVLFHCMAGKDRTGLIAAVMLALADVVPEAIAYDYAASSERLRDAYIERYTDSDPAEIIEAVRCPEEGVYNMLEYLESRGGIHAYLQEIGLGRSDIERLRARLRE